MIDEFYPPIKRLLPQFDFFIGTLHKEMFGYYASALLINCLVLIRKDKNNQHEYGYAYQLNLIIDSFLGNHHNYKYYEIIEIDYATVIKFNFDQKDQIEQLYKKNISGLKLSYFYNCVQIKRTWETPIIYAFISRFKYEAVFNLDFKMDTDFTAQYETRIFFLKELGLNE